MTALGRSALEIIRDFAAATERLHRITCDWRASQFRTGDLIDASNTLEGLRALMRELRTGEGSE